ncbi:MAG: ABC transporter ATP-binding protein [Hyphomicrobiaceae bacterium]|nr:ABC transporter ATP-binding protein [Hyphomicrobiaceae bacterium]
MRLVPADGGPPVAAASARRAGSGRPSLKFDRVGFSYGNRGILDNVSFEVEPGEIVSLLGPSGCGKTTILNLIAGFLTPTSGVCLAAGREIAGPGPDRGVVFQSAALFDWMTVAENIAFSLRCAHKSRRERQAIAEEMGALVGLADRLGAYPYELSGGMRQRVGLARVLAAKPTVMLMDEPFSALDVQTRETLQEELLRIQRHTGATIVFITHSIDEAIYLGQRVFLATSLATGAYDEFAVALPEPRDDPENRLHPEFIRLREIIYRRMRSGSGQGNKAGGR